MENELVILSQIKFGSEDKEKIFLNFLKEFNEKINSSVSNATPKKGIIDASNINIDLSDIVAQFHDKFTNLLGGGEITRQDLLWLVNDIGYGNSPEGLMLSFSYTKTEQRNIFQRLSKILKSAGAIKMKVCRMSTGEEEVLEL